MVVEILEFRMEGRGIKLWLQTYVLYDKIRKTNIFYDKIHRMFLVHEKGKRWILVQDEELDRDAIKWFSAMEALYVKLWKCFFESISIKERENYERQRQHLPLRYRTHVVEFQKE